MSFLENRFLNSGVSFLRNCRNKSNNKRNYPQCFYPTISLASRSAAPGICFYLFSTVLLPDYLLCKPLGSAGSSELINDGFVFGLHSGDILFVFQQLM